MPNIHQLGKRERKTRIWIPEVMVMALQQVEASMHSVRRAAKQFEVPKTTLWSQLSALVQRAHLTPEDENSLVEYCLYSASRGFSLMKPHVVANALAIYNLRHLQFLKTVLGQTWWINFRERHHHRLTAQTSLEAILCQEGAHRELL